MSPGSRIFRPESLEGTTQIERWPARPPSNGTPLPCERAVKGSKGDSPSTNENHLLGSEARHSARPATESTGTAAGLSPALEVTKWKHDPW